MVRINPELENWKQVYDEVEMRRRSRWFTRGVATAMKQVYKPNVIHLPGAKEEIREVRARGKAVLYAINHASFNDPNVAIGGAAQEPSLRQGIDDMNVLVTATLLRGGRLNPLPAVVRETGGIPVYRKKDNPDADPLLLQGAGDRMLEVAARAVARGEDMAGFPEGTRNMHDLTHLQMVNTGMAHIAHQARELELGEDPEAEQGFVFLPVGLSYGVLPLPESPIREFLQTRHATVCFGHPIEELERVPFQTTRVVKAGMQAVLAAAHEDYYERRGVAMPAH